MNSKQVKDLTTFNALLFCLCALAAWWLSILYVGFRFGPHLGFIPDEGRLPLAKLAYEFVACYLSVTRGWFILVLCIVFLRNWLDSAYTSWGAVKQALWATLLLLMAPVCGVFLGWLMCL